MSDGSGEGERDDSPADRLTNVILLQLVQSDHTTVRLRSGGGPVEKRAPGGPWELEIEQTDLIAEKVATRLAEMVNVTDLWPGPCHGHLRLVTGEDQVHLFDLWFRPRASGDVRVIIQQVELRADVEALVGTSSDAVRRACQRYYQNPSEEADAEVQRAMTRMQTQGMAGVMPLLEGIWTRVQHLAERQRWVDAGAALEEVEQTVRQHWGQCPEVTQLCAARGQISLEAGALDDARAHFEKALAGATQTFEFHPLAAELLDSLADVAERQDRHGEALTLRDRAVALLSELDPDDAAIRALRPH